MSTVFPPPVIPPTSALPAPGQVAKCRTRASLHAKCVIIDRSRALVTSANFTNAAKRKNVEVGVDIRYPPAAARLADYFLGLCRKGQLAACALH